MIKKVPVLGTFTLAMITVAAIVSLRNLPLSAEFGLAAIFYYVISALIFFIPIALVTAELASAWPEAGGTYLWVGKAFGKKWGFFAIWLAWMGIIVWFPAILAFTAAMLAHLMAPFYPALEESKMFYFSVMLVVFWGATFLNFLGVGTSGWISTLGVLAGTVIPGVLIIGLGLGWFFLGHRTHIAFHWGAIIPEFKLENMVLLSGILLSLVGAEVAAYHIREARNPRESYPKALAIAAVVILLISILGTLAIAMVVPQENINLLSGLIQAFTVFFKTFNITWAVPLVALLALIGSLATINTWIVGPAKGLLETAEAGFLPPMLRYVNKLGVPVGMLLFQASIGTLLSFIFLWMDSHSAAYWVLTAISAQFALIQYAWIFAAGIRLRYSEPKVERAYRVPGGKLGMWLVSGVGMIACFFGFLIVFIPPAQLQMGKRSIYLLVATFIILSILPILLGRSRWRSKD